MAVSLRDRLAVTGFVCLLIITLVSIVILAWVPPVSRDALTHHLFVPRLYLQHGRMLELPHVEFSYYPQLLELLYCIPLYFQNDIFPKYIHFSFALATAWLIFRYLRKRLSVRYAWLGALFFLTLPLIVRLSITVYVDLGLIFFTTAALLSLVKWREREAKWRYLLASAFFTGLAAGTKYNGLIVIFLLSLAVPFLVPRRLKKSWQGAGRLLFFFLVAVAVFSPWMIRNYVWTGNPVYPLYSGVFSDVADDGGVSSDEVGWTHFTVRKYVYHEKWWETLTTPARIFFVGQDDNPRFFDGVLSPFLFLLPFLAFFGVRGETRKELWLFLWFAALFIIFAFLKIDMRIRYVCPVIPALIILSVFGLRNLEQTLLPGMFKSRKSVRLVFGAVIIIIFTWNYHYLAGLFQEVRPIGYLTGQVSREAYIERHVQEYPLVRYLNETTSGRARILALFLGRRGYYFDREVRFAGSLFSPRDENAPASAEELRHDLREQGFTHLLVRYELFQRRVKNVFDNDQQALINDFFQNSVTLLKARAGYGAYEIKR